VDEVALKSSTTLPVSSLARAENRIAKVKLINYYVCELHKVRNKNANSNCKSSNNNDPFVCYAFTTAIEASNNHDCVILLEYHHTRKGNFHAPNSSPRPELRGTPLGLLRAGDTSMRSRPGLKEGGVLMSALLWAKER
jgi:hypothetical protein